MHPVFSPGESVRRTVIGPAAAKPVFAKPVAGKFVAVESVVGASGEARHMTNSSNGISMTAIALWYDFFALLSVVRIPVASCSTI
jgi:hypothetical protein